MRLFRLNKLAGFIGASLLSAVSASSYAAQCEYVLDSQWGSGFVARIKVTNDTNEPVNGWQINWEFSGDNRINNSLATGLPCILLIAEDALDSTRPHKNFNLKVLSPACALFRVVR